MKFQFGGQGLCISGMKYAGSYNLDVCKKIMNSVMPE